MEDSLILETKEFTNPQKKVAKLKLAFLKENHGFRAFFPSLKKDPYTHCRLLRKPDEEKEDYLKRIASINPEICSPVMEIVGLFKVNLNAITLFQKYSLISTNSILNLFDPENQLTEEKDEELLSVLPWLFYCPSVREFRLSPETDRQEVIKPYECLLIIDLRRKEADLVDDFRTRLRTELQVCELGREFGLESLKWSIAKSRDRQEAWKQLEVWRLRRQKISFRRISEKQNEKLGTVKSRFYRAYERIEGKKYDPSSSSKNLSPIQISELKKTCETCEDHECYATLGTEGGWTPCPEVLGYINQDQVPLREKPSLRF